jgi:hypothetical protein
MSSNSPTNDVLVVPEELTGALDAAAVGEGVVVQFRGVRLRWLVGICRGSGCWSRLGGLGRLGGEVDDDGLLHGLRESVGEAGPLEPVMHGASGTDEGRSEHGERR